MRKAYSHTIFNECHTSYFFNEIPRRIQCAIYIFISDPNLKKTRSLEHPSAHRHDKYSEKKEDKTEGTFHIFIKSNLLSENPIQLCKYLLLRQIKTFSYCSLLSWQTNYITLCPKEKSHSGWHRAKRDFYFTLKWSLQESSFLRIYVSVHSF